MIFFCLLNGEQAVSRIEGAIGTGPPLSQQLVELRSVESLTVDEGALFEPNVLARQLLQARCGW